MEYRSHIYFVLRMTTLHLVKKQMILKTVSVKLIPVFGISIPVIIRVGNVSATASLVIYL
jgi:hypothetical protein